MRWWGAILVSVVLVRCSPNRVTLPQSTIVSISYLKSLYKGLPLTITDDIAISGWVTSTDQFGEWYKTLVIEDGSEGLELKLTQTNLFETYRVGSVIYVRCNSLMLNSYGGTLQLDQITNHIDIIGQLPQSPTYTTTTIRELLPQLISRYVRLDELEFITEEVGQPLGSEYDYTNRHLIDRVGDTIILRISPHFRYASTTIPAESGTALGIISYFNGEYELKLNTISDLFFYSNRF